jgi:thioredoxin 1
MSNAVLDLTESTFDEEVIGSPVPLVVEFWAEWCPPCKAMASVLHALADEQEGRWRFVRINADEQPDLGRRFDVVSVPTFLVFADGQLRQRLVGARSQAQFLAEIERAISS